MDREEAKDRRRNYGRRGVSESTTALDKSMAAAMACGGTLESGRHGSGQFNWIWTFPSGSQFCTKPWKKLIVTWLDGDMHGGTDQSVSGHELRF